MIAVDNININLGQKNRIVGIIGENGAGKSTLHSIITFSKRRR